MTGHVKGLAPAFRLLAASAVVLSVCLAVPGAAYADPGARTFTLSAGRAPYDLSGTGTTTMFGFAVELPVNRTFVVEPGMRYFRYRSQGDDAVSFFLPEVSLQAQTHLGVVRPYVGIGAGAAFLTGGHDRSDLTAHAALGVRAPISARSVARLELRARAIDPFLGSTADFTFGIGMRF